MPSARLNGQTWSWWGPPQATKLERCNMHFDTTEPQLHPVLIDKLTIGIVPSVRDTLMAPATTPQCAPAHHDGLIGAQTAALARDRLVAAEQSGLNGHARLALRRWHTMTTIRPEGSVNCRGTKQGGDDRRQPGAVCGFAERRCARCCSTLVTSAGPEE